MDIESILNFKKPNSETKIFGLIGSPLHHSIGHIFHNEYFQKFNHNALYVNWEIQQHELPQAIPLLKNLVSGLSVTMPLKENIFPYVDKIEPEAQKVGAINTISLETNTWLGSNTDGLGAINALGVPIKNKIIAVLGSGGAAKAIIYTAVHFGAKVLIFNRDKQKANKLTQQFGAVKAYELDELKEIEFDILINTLPFNVILKLNSIKTSHNCESKILMDITNTENESWVVEFAKKFHYQYFDRLPMFREQALLQLKKWGY